jgi:hypothetical protein
VSVFSSAFGHKALKIKRVWDFKFAGINAGVSVLIFV